MRRCLARPCTIQCCGFQRYPRTKLIFQLSPVWLPCLILLYMKQSNLPLKFIQSENSDSNNKQRIYFPSSSLLALSPSTAENMGTFLTNNKQALTLKETQLPHDIPSTPEKDECSFPQPDPFDPVVMSLSKFYPPISCTGKVPQLVYLSGDALRVNHSKTSLVGDSNHTFRECRYRALAKNPGTDFETIVTYTSDPFDDAIILREEGDDELIAQCYSNNNYTVLSRSYISRIHPKKELEDLLESYLNKHILKNSPKEVLNVLMVGLDGNSKQTLQRHMPKTRNFLLQELQALELHKYNKFGDHTYFNLIPLLTGKSWMELERKNWTWVNHFDPVNHEFIWSHFRQAGYRTGLFFDETFVTAFHYYKKGWDNAPVDYYKRATVVELQKDLLMKPNRVHDCVGDVPEIVHNNDFWIQMASVFNKHAGKPYFGFSFSIHLTHEDHNYASAGDDHYLRFFQELRDKNLINNTVLIFFSDHGERFGPVRPTINGMVESKTPHVFLVFPPWFYLKYPELSRVLRLNQNRLTTNRDIHATLKDLINFQARTGLGDLRAKGISLFQEIPAERTCAHADLSLEYCLCNQLGYSNVSQQVEHTLAAGLISRINSMTDKLRDKCMPLSLHSVLGVMRVNSHQQIAGGTAYQITLTTRPNDGIYEAALVISDDASTAEVKGDITRLNMYMNQADCIENPTLRSYCYCYKT